MDPTRVRETFDSQIEETIAFFQTVKGFLKLDADITKLCALTMISAATTWESFLSDLIIAYINRDPSRFATHLEDTFKQDMNEKQKEIQKRYAPFSAPTNIDRASIAALIDSNGNNITFSNAAALKKGAKRWVSAANFTRINALTKKQMAIIDLWIALRNHIAHDSKRSREALKKAVSRGNLHGTGLHRKQNAIHSPGVYLKSKHKQPEGNPRIEEILRHMREIAAVI